MRRTTGGILGRDTELDAARMLLAAGPVVTVTGVGGVGKTRLAEAVAAAETDRRVVVCELGSADEPTAVPFAVADALRFPSLDAAVAGVGRDPVLLVMDNCEHVLDAAAEAITQVVDRCPGVVVLATSREALGVPGEQVLPLEPLGLPAGDALADAAASPAVQLLIARATAAGATLDLEADPAAVVTLCRRLDGLPLAIELAAARLRSVTPHEVIGYLDRRQGRVPQTPDGDIRAQSAAGRVVGPTGYVQYDGSGLRLASDQLDHESHRQGSTGHGLGLLRREHDRGPQRHRSLEAAIEWSYERLPEPTRVFFERLAVFSGRFTAQQVHAVAAEPDDDLVDTVERLDLLVAQSLVTVDQKRGRTWYGLLHTLRSFARQRLVERGELHRVRGRWVDSLVTMATEARARLLHEWSADLVVTLQRTHGDVADALRWCVANDETPDRALPLFVPLCALLKRRSAMPIAELGDLVLARWPDTRHVRWAEVVAAASLAHVLRGSGERGAALARQAIGARSSGLAEVNARRALFFHARMTGHDADGLRWIDEAIPIAAAHGMQPWHNELLTFRAIALASLGRVEEAIAQVAEAYRAAPVTTSPALEAWAAAVQACLVALRDPVAARAMCAEAARYCEEVDYPIGATISLRTLGALAMLAGEHAASAGFLIRAIAASVGIGYASETALTLRWAARLAHLSGRTRTAETLWRSAGRARRDVVDDVLGPTDVDRRIASGDAPALLLAESVMLARTELTAIADGIAARSSVPVAARAENRLCREGAVWTVVFAGATVRLPDAKGLHDLALLLARPGREVHCTELMGAMVEQPDTGPVLDVAARRAYEARIVELQGELAEAEDFGDTGRAESVRTEMELLVGELTSAIGLAGRSRRTGAGTDRVRSAVSQRIRAVLRRFEELHPPLGEHLKASVQTGTWCAYRPDPPVHWDR